ELRTFCGVRSEAHVTAGEVGAHIVEAEPSEELSEVRRTDRDAADVHPAQQGHILHARALVFSSRPVTYLQCFAGFLLRRPGSDSFHAFCFGEVFDTGHDRPAHSERVKNGGEAVAGNKRARRFTNRGTRVFCSFHGGVDIRTVQAHRIADALARRGWHEAVIRAGL